MADPDPESDILEHLEAELDNVDFPTPEVFSSCQVADLMIDPTLNSGWISHEDYCYLWYRYHRVLDANTGVSRDQITEHNELVREYNRLIDEYNKLVEVNDRNTKALNQANAVIDRMQSSWLFRVVSEIGKTR
jgi:hypothetical protein